MKIVAPLTKHYDYEPLVEAGVDEVFCGVIPYQWLRKYTTVMPINRREFFLYNFNMCTMTSMKIIARMVEKHKIPVKITLNAHYYIESQYPTLLDIIANLMDLGFDSFVVADPAFVVYLREKNIPCRLHVSGEMEIINHLAVRFLNRLGVSRIVFPRKITLSDMKSCIKNSCLPEMEYEAFVLNELCHYSGAFCNSIHTCEMPTACFIPNRIIKFRPISRFPRAERILKKMAVKSDSLESLHAVSGGYTFGDSGCGLCRIKEMMIAGVTHLKVVGRGMRLENILSDVKKLKKIIGGAIDAEDVEEFARDVKKEYFAHGCPPACYYP